VLATASRKLAERFDVRAGGFGRINDRVPYVRGRSFDLSRSAARQIGLTAREYAASGLP